MQPQSKHILFIGFSIGMAGLLYFLSLTINLPFLITAGLTIVSLFMFGRWILHSQDLFPVVDEKTRWFHYLIVICGLALLGYNCFQKATKYGSWDAWAIWNFSAKFLSDPQEWRCLYLNIYSHVSYPLGLPSAIAFFNRLFFLHDVQPVAFVVGLVVAVCVPILIYFELYRKQLIVAVIILFSFAIDQEYASKAMSQYADTLLGFFFLAAIIISGRGSGSKNSVILYSIFLAFCIWTKDEGLMLALVFILFHFRDFLKKKNMLIFLSIMIIPAIAIIYQKSIHTVGADIITGQKASPLSYLTQPERYSLVWQYLVSNLNEQFIQLKIAVLVYIILCALSLRIPSKNFLLLLTCMFGYFMVYIITPFDLDWHLRTSQNRLMHQLLPSFMFVIGNDIATKDFFFSRKQNFETHKA